MTPIGGDLSEIGAGFEVFAVPAPPAHGGHERACDERREHVHRRGAREQDAREGDGGPTPVQVSPAHDSCRDHAEQASEQQVQRGSGTPLDEMLDRRQGIDPLGFTRRRAGVGCCRWGHREALLS